MLCLTAGMNDNSSLLVQIRPRSFTLWRALPIFGPLLDDFLRWLHDQKYTEGTIRNFLKALPKVVHWLLRHRITQLEPLTLPDLHGSKDRHLSSFSSRRKSRPSEYAGLHQVSPQMLTQPIKRNSLGSAAISSS